MNYKPGVTALGDGRFQCTVRASRCGAYRLNARYRVNGGPYVYYTDHGLRRDGAVVQFVPCGARAWHAGASEFEIHVEYQRAAGQTERDLPYGNIIALNEMAAVLHYQHQRSVRPAERRSFLIDAGAQFLMTPHTDPDVIKLCKKSKILSLAGALWVLVIDDAAGGEYLREYWAPVMLDPRLKM